MNAYFGNVKSETDFLNSTAWKEIGGKNQGTLEVNFHKTAFLLFGELAKGSRVTPHFQLIIFMKKDK
jgi:hypothetical protein